MPHDEAPCAVDLADTAARAGLEGLLERAEVATGHPPLSEASLLALRETNDDVRGLVLRDGAALLGYAHLGRWGRSWSIELVLDPGAPDRTRRALLEAAVGEAHREGATEIRYWSMQHEGGDELATDFGFSIERDLLQMRVPLPLQVERRPTPSGFVLRPFRPGNDEDRWLEVNNRAFATHPEQGHWERADLLAREAAAWFDPAGFLLCERGATLAASCWTKVHPSSRPAMGEIYVISVNPDFQGQGLGRLLTVAGLDWLAERVSLGMLYVDGSNAAAVSLYRSLGFEIDHVDRAYLRREVGE